MTRSYLSAIASATADGFCVCSAAFGSGWNSGGAASPGQRPRQKRVEDLIVENADTAAGSSSRKRGDNASSPRSQGDCGGLDFSECRHRFLHQGKGIGGSFRAHRNVDEQLVGDDGARDGGGDADALSGWHRIGECDGGAGAIGRAVVMKFHKIR